MDRSVVGVHGPGVSVFGLPPMENVLIKLTLQCE